MRIILVIVGWVLSIGAVLNAAFAAAALYFVAKGYFAEPALSVEALFSEHLPFMLWTRSAAEAILPSHVAEFFFSAPALVIFPLRAAVAGALGLLAFRTAAGCANASPPSLRPR